MSRITEGTWLLFLNWPLNGMEALRQKWRGCCVTILSRISCEVRIMVKSELGQVVLSLARWREMLTQVTRADTFLDGVWLWQDISMCQGGSSGCEEVWHQFPPGTETSSVSKVSVWHWSVVCQGEQTTVLWWHSNTFELEQEELLQLLGSKGLGSEPKSLGCGSVCVAKWGWWIWQALKVAAGGNWWIPVCS